jgi:hypothetical protein
MPNLLKADEVSLKSGDIVVCQLLDIDSSSIKIKSSLFNDIIDIKWSDINKLHSQIVWTIAIIGNEQIEGTIDYFYKTGITVHSSRLGNINLNIDDIIGATISEKNTLIENLDTKSVSEKNKIEFYGRENKEDTLPLTFLRGSTVLLKPWQVEGRLSFSYIPTQTSSYGTYQQRLLMTTLGINVGLHERLEGWVYVPFGYARAHTDSIFYIGKSKREKTFELMDITVGFNALLVPESEKFPELSISVSTAFPTAKTTPYSYDNLLRLGNGHLSSTVGLHAVNSTEPAILFFGVLATYTWDNTDKYGNNFIFGNNGWSWDYYFGVGMAINDRLSMSTRFLGGYRPPRYVRGDNDEHFSTDPMWMSFGLGYRIRETIVIEPSFTFGLNDVAGDPRLTLSISKKFN